ncbi:MAG: hypothetical protein HIU92_02590 [Proteobacteria bacterium]|nr:hypothetical protein [Pseudomonadota bacterium]
MNNATIRELQAIRAAEAEVAPYAGQILGMDSANAVYRAALAKLGHDVTAVPAYASMKPIFTALKGKRAPRELAQDAAAAKGFDQRYPGRSRSKTGGI